MSKKIRKKYTSEFKEEAENNTLGEKSAVTKKLRRLRSENKRLRIECEILKKAAIQRVKRTWDSMWAQSC